jgi:hypothetical protein
MDAALHLEACCETASSELHDERAFDTEACCSHHDYASTPDAQRAPDAAQPGSPAACFLEVTAIALQAPPAASMPVAGPRAPPPQNRARGGPAPPLRTSARLALLSVLVSLASRARPAPRSAGSRSRPTLAAEEET